MDTKVAELEKAHRELMEQAGFVRSRVSDLERYAASASADAELDRGWIAEFDRIFGAGAAAQIPTRLEAAKQELAEIDRRSEETWNVLCAARDDAERAAVAARHGVPIQQVTLCYKRHDESQWRSDRHFHVDGLA